MLLLLLLCHMPICSPAVGQFLTLTTKAFTHAAVRHPSLLAELFQFADCSQVDRTVYNAADCICMALEDVDVSTTPCLQLPPRHQAGPRPVLTFLWRPDILAHTMPGGATLCCMLIHKLWHAQVDMGVQTLAWACA